MAQTKRQQIVKNLLKGLLDLFNQDDDKSVQCVLSADDQEGEYILFQNGWKGTKRYYGIIIHLSVKKDGKIWLQRDNTDLHIAQQLLDAGIKKSELVLGFQPPMVRPDTGFAVA